LLSRRRTSRYATTPWLFRYEIDATELGPALKRLAELHDLRGDKSKAATVRGQLLQLWRRADSELQPVVADGGAGSPADGHPLPLLA